MECKPEEGCKILKRFGRSGWKCVYCVCVCVCVTVKETALSFLITDYKSLQRHLSQAGLCWEHDSQIGFLSLLFFSFFFCVVYNHIFLFLFSSLLRKRFYHPCSCNSVLLINKQLQVRIFSTLTLIVEVAFLKSAIKVTGLNTLHDSPVCVLRFYCLRMNARHGSAAFHSCSSQLSHSVS